MFSCSTTTAARLSLQHNLVYLPALNVGQMRTAVHVLQRGWLERVTQSTVPCFPSLSVLTLIAHAIPNLKVEWFMRDGAQIDTSSVENGRVAVARVTGGCRDILQGERTALNVISRCSGVATATYQAVQQAKAMGWKGYVAGTRKTTPGE